MSPILWSLFDDIVATSFNRPFVTAFDIFFNDATTLAHSICIWRSTSVLSFLMCNIPASTNALVNTIDVVVPSPAVVAVLSAASRIIRTARFSVGSTSPIDFATVTPSLVTVIPCVCSGDSINTVWPDGPNVLLTASAILFMPFTSFSLASSLNSNFFGVNPVIWLSFMRKTTSTCSLLEQDEKSGFSCQECHADCQVWGALLVVVEKIYIFYFS